MTSPRERRAVVLVLLCVASFSIVFNNLIIAPLIPDLSDDLGVPTSMSGLLVTGYAVTAGIGAIFAGPVIDRFGHRRVIVAGMGILSLATFGSAIAPEYVSLLATRLVAGVGVAVLGPTVFAAVSEMFDYSERGRAMAWVVTANTVAPIFGIPIGGLLGAVSWRFTFAFLGVISLLFTALLVAKMPELDTGTVGTPATLPGLRSIGVVARDFETMMAIISTCLATAYFLMFLTYVGAFYHDEFGVPKAALGFVTMILGFGTLIGSNVGGRFSDRHGKRPLIIWGSAVCAVAIFLETTVTSSIVLAVALFLVFAAAGGARFSSQQALVSELRTDVRSSVVSMNESARQFGVVLGSGIGALVLAIGDYLWIGPVSSAIALVSLVTVALFVHERDARTSDQPRAPVPAEVS